MYKFYLVSLMPDQTGVGLIVHVKQLNCIKLFYISKFKKRNNISCDNHIADVENIYSLIVKACIISTSITVQYQRKVTRSRNITSGWNRELDYARESSLFWKRMWIQCDETKYIHFFTFIKK